MAIPFDKDVPSRTIRLINKVHHLSGIYEDMSLLCALDAAMPLELIDTYDQEGNLTLLEVFMNF